VPDYVVTADVPAALGLLSSPGFDPTSQVVLLEQPDETSAGALAETQEAGSESAAAAARVVIYEPNRVVIETESQQPGWLVLSDTYYRGWEATVDGRSAAIYQANGCVRAVPLEMGQHEIVFRFRPRSFYTGALISGLSALFWVIAWVWLRRR
jgi:uncharacterized membrane protein YfhO